MAKVFIDNWTPVKDSKNTRLIVVFAQFELDHQDVEIRKITDATADNNATSAFNIINGDKTGKFWFQAEIYLSKPHSQLPENHEIIIESYIVETKHDDDSMDTGSAPTW